jgi:hypothetical protein
MVTIPQAMASFTGISKETRRGIRMLAPPSPVSDPSKPTGTDISRSDIIFIMGWTASKIKRRFNTLEWEEPQTESLGDIAFSGSQKGYSYGVTEIKKYLPEKRVALR